MTNVKDQMLRLIRYNAAQEAVVLAGQLIDAKPDEKEQIRAGLEFEKWLERTCSECLD